MFHCDGHYGIANRIIITSGVATLWVGWAVAQPRGFFFFFLLYLKKKKNLKLSNLSSQEFFFFFGN